MENWELARCIWGIVHGTCGAEDVCGEWWQMTRWRWAEMSPEGAGEFQHLLEAIEGFK